MPSPIPLNLKQFDMNRVKDESICLFIGKRKSGKSFAVRDLLYHNRDIPLGIIFSGTEKASPFFKDFFPKSFIFSEYNEDVIETLLNRQMTIKKKEDKRKEDHKKKGMEYTGPQTDGRAMLILDDMMDDAQNWSKSKPVKTVFFNGRHYSIFFVLTLQYPVGMGPNLRSNVDWIFIMRENQKNIRKKIYENYAGCFDKQEIFETVMDNLKEYECIVVDNNAKSPKLEDQVFLFKATARDDFKVGCKSFWNLHKQIPESDDDEENGNEGGKRDYESTKKRKYVLKRNE